jgi:superfamily I DNA/RNA helicase/RecB family exonuclease
VPAARRSPDYRLVRRARPPVAVPVLDEAQRRVVEHPGGPLLVLAGPGTGKTTTLVEAAAARVRSGVPIDDILLLTFGRRAATELRDRLTARLGRTSREPLARTFHSYAFGVLRLAAVAGGLPAPRLLTGPEQDVIVRDLIAGDAAENRSPWPSELAPALATRGFAGELRDLLLRAVERGLDGPRLSALGRRYDRADWVAAGTFLTEYQNVTALSRPGAYDPAELIQAAVGALRDDPELLAAERGRRRRIFVDEYQDTDPSQAELLSLLADGADELIVVGDPDQSIYAFRGADASAMRDAADRFGDPPVVALATCRRSGAALLAASRRIAAQLPGPAAQRRLIPAPQLPPGNIDVCVLRSATEEAGYVATVLRRAHLEDGLAWSRMAVVVRSTQTALPILRRALTTAGVPVSVRGEDLPLPDQPAVAHMLTALRCVVLEEPIGEDVADALVLGPIGRGDPLVLRRLRRELRRQARASGEPEAGVLGRAVLDPSATLALPERLGGPLGRVSSSLLAGREQARRGASAEEVLWAMWEPTGLPVLWERASGLGGPSGAAADRDLDSVLALFAAAARFTDRLPQAGAAQFLEHLAAQQIPGDALFARDADSDAVQILTAHASKGLEWDLVCVASVQEGSWPDLRQRGSLLGSEILVDVLAGRHVPNAASFAPQLAEERRLFYVAITRARRRLVVTAVSGQDEQPSRLLDELDPIDGEREVTIPPRGVHLPGLIAELRSAVCDPAATRSERSAAASELARLAVEGISGADPDDWWGLAEPSVEGPIADPDRPVRISPSRIDSFLICELRDVLRGVGASDGDQVSASLGTLIHDVAAKAAPDADLEEFERLLDEGWGQLDFGALWLAVNERARAREILDRLIGWLRRTRDELTLVAVEEPFDVVTGDVELVGRVDRIEKDRDGRLVVVDLKTGKSKPRTDDLPHHPQLGAYQLAVALGGFAGGDVPGGARLVQLAASGMITSGREQAQGPLADADDPQWVADAVSTMARRLRGREFSAIVGSHCKMCDVASCCPLIPGGQQVTE